MEGEKPVWWKSRWKEPLAPPEIYSISNAYEIKSKNYAYILGVQAVAYFGKLAIHPGPAGDWQTFLDRAAIGPLPGLAVVLAGVAFHGAWIATALWTLQIERRHRKRHRPAPIA